MNRRASSLPPSLPSRCSSTSLEEYRRENNDTCCVRSDKPCLVKKEDRNDEFGIDLDRTRGQALGIDIDRSDGVTLLIENVREGGLVDLWNKQNPASEVNVGHRICEVNGMRNNALELIQLLKECRNHHIKIRACAEVHKQKTVHFDSDISTMASDSEGSCAPHLSVTDLTEEFAIEPDDASANEEFNITLKKTGDMLLGIEIDFASGSKSRASLGCWCYLC